MSVKISAKAQALEQGYRRLGIDTPPFWEQAIDSVPDEPTGLPCAPTEHFGEVYEIEGKFFQWWGCPCGQGIDAQVEPEDVLTPTIKAHLRGEWPAK